MKVQCAHTEMVDVDLLVPHPLNPNKHGERQIEMLAKIMNHQGWRHPITVSKRSGFIVAGHGRLMAAKKLGWTQAPVDRQEFDTEADEYAHLIADNKIAELAEHDDLKMFDDLKKFPDLDLDLLGIPDFELPMPEIVPGCDADDVPEALPEPKVVRGEVYILGNHRLMCGDSTTITDVERLMNGEKADMLFTDPPYGVKYDESWRENSSGYFGGSEKGQLKNDDIADWTPAYLLADVSIAYVWHASQFAHVVRQGLIDSKFQVRQQIIWRKPFGVLSRQNYNWQHEPCWYAIKNGCSANWADDNTQTTVWDVENPNHPMSKKGDGDVKTGHPTMKPVRLAEIAIRNHIIKSVLDLFGGSGSTLIACEKTNRKCFMMELDPHYCGVILDRWQKFTGKKAHREDGVAWDEIRQ